MTTLPGRRMMRKVIVAGLIIWTSALAVRAAHAHFAYISGR